MSTSYKVVILAIATWYGEDHHGLPMSNGEPFNMHAMTCATWLYPIGTILTVEYVGDSVEVVVTDKCDNATEIDLSKAAFAKICDPDAGQLGPDGTGTRATVIFELEKQTEEWMEKYGDPQDL